MNPAAPKDQTQSPPRFLWIALGAVLGAVLVCACALAAGLLLWRFSVQDAAQAAVSAPPDARVRIWLEEDGCHVRRSEVEGKDAVRLLTWVVRDADGYTVLERAADGEYTYGYFRGGQYRIHLKAWHQGRYWQVSDEVVVHCP